MTPERIETQVSILKSVKTRARPFKSTEPQEQMQRNILEQSAMCDCEGSAFLSAGQTELHVRRLSEFNPLYSFFHSFELLYQYHVHTPKTLNTSSIPVDYVNQTVDTCPYAYIQMQSMTTSSEIHGYLSQSMFTTSKTLCNYSIFSDI